MSRKYLIALSTLTAYMRQELLKGNRYHLLDLARIIQEDPCVVEDLLATALVSDYRDEQLEIFCSMIRSTVWPKEFNSATTKMNFTVLFPSRKIFAALSQYPQDRIDAMLDTEEGRQQMGEYIDRYYIPARDAWLAQLDNDLEASGLSKKMDALYPKRDLKNDIINRAIEHIQHTAPSDLEEAATLMTAALGREVRPEDIVKF